MLFLIFLKVFMSSWLIIRLLQRGNIQYITDGIILRGFHRSNQGKGGLLGDLFKIYETRDLLKDPVYSEQIGLLTGFVLQRKVEKNTDYYMTETRVCTVSSTGTWHGSCQCTYLWPVFKFVKRKTCTMRWSLYITKPIQKCSTLIQSFHFYTLDVFASRTWTLRHHFVLALASVLFSFLFLSECFHGRVCVSMCVCGGVYMWVKYFYTQTI